MEVLTPTEVHVRFDEVADRVNQGDLFIYPTDTIYGVGCKATDTKATQKIREMKGQRPTAPFSIIVPSLKWVQANCLITKKAELWLQKLPGPYTLIIQLNNKKALASNAAPLVETIGIRYPDHWFAQVVKKLGFPIITTSANKTGEPFMTSLENLDPDVELFVDFVIYEGPKEGRPSKIIDVEKEEVKER